MITQGVSPVLVEAMVRAVVADDAECSTITATTPIQDLSEAQLLTLYQGESHMCELEDKVSPLCLLITHEIEGFKYVGIVRHT